MTTNNETTINLPTAAMLATIGQTQIAAGRAAVLQGTIAAALGRVAYVQRWHVASDAPNKASDYDTLIKEQIDGARATVFRVAALIKATSLFLAKDCKTVLASAKLESAEQAVSMVVRALADRGAVDLQSLKELVVGGASDSAKKSEDEKLVAYFGNGDKVAALAPETLKAIMSAISIEVARRANDAAKATAPEREEQAA